MLHIVVKAVQMDSENNIKKLAIHKLFFQGKLSKDELDRYLNQLGSGELDESFPDFYEVEQFIENNPQPKLNTNVKRMNRFSWFVAASVILICFLAISLSIWKSVNKKTATLVWKTVEAPISKKAMVELLDGTQIEIASGSKIEYPEKFNDSIREVRLIQGKIFLKVAKDISKPFVLKSESLETRVLGTSFTVEYYKNTGKSAINLYEGKVQVKNNLLNSLHELKPGQLYDWDEHKRKEDLSEFDLEENPAVVGSLKFKQLRLENALMRIGLLHGIEISLKDQGMEENKITGNFDGLTWKEIMEALEAVYPIKFKKISENKFEVYGD